MSSSIGVRRISFRAVPLLVTFLLASCGEGGSSQPAPPAPNPQVSPGTTGTGSLTLKIESTDAYPLPGAGVRLTLQGGIEVAHGEADGNGTITFHSLPPRVQVSAFHEFGQSVSFPTDVDQGGSTTMSIVMTPQRPRPVVALLPVEVPPGGVNADRSELRLQFRLVASPSAPFLKIDSGWPLASPYLGISFGHPDSSHRRDCHLFMDRTSVVPVCETWGSGPFDVEAEQLAYDAAGTVPMPPAPGAPQSTMLVLDQGRRIAEFDARGYRSFAARRLIERLLTGGPPGSVFAVSGMAGPSGDPASPSALPRQPLWLPRGAGMAFSADRQILTSDVRVLEPLTGGGSPVLAGLHEAATVIGDEAPAGTKTLVAVLGGGDNSPASGVEREASKQALLSEARAHDIHIILVAAAAEPEVEGRIAMGELAAELRAPIISLGVAPVGNGFNSGTPAYGSYAALDLAAALIAGERLPTLSATIRVKADAANAFPAGRTLNGVVYLQSEACPFDCLEVPIEFAVKIP